MSRTPSAPVPRSPARVALSLFVPLTATVLLVPVIPWLATAAGVVFLARWYHVARTDRAAVEAALTRYHVPPLARAADCIVVLIGALLGTRGGPIRSRLLAATAAAGFLVALVAPFLLLKLSKGFPSLEDAGLGVAVGVVGWHVLGELPWVPHRFGLYRDEGHGNVVLWALGVLFVCEFAAFLVLRETGFLPDHPFLRGLLVGIAGIGAADAAALASTLLLLAFGRRVLR